MPKQQLIALCAYNLLIFAVGSSMVALFPLYATRLGADPGSIGFYMALAYLALSTGMIGSGWLTDRVQRRKFLLVATGLANVVLIGCFSQVTSVGALVLLACVTWFSFGVSMAMVNILTGLFVGQHERGKVFGILGCSIAAGNLLAGLWSGRVVDRWGFDVFFAIGALVYLLAPLVALFVQDKVVPRRENQGAKLSLRRVLLNRSYLLLFAASVLMYIAIGETLLGRSLLMDRLGFDTTAITSSFAVGALFSLPLPFVVGRLSDRLPRVYLLIACYASVALGMTVLAGSTSLSHFWLSAGLLAGSGASLSVGSALVADVVPRHALGTALSWFNATNWIGFVLGFIIVGVGARSVGLEVTMLFGAALALGAGLLLMVLRGSEAASAAARTSPALSIRD